MASVFYPGLRPFLLDYEVSAGDHLSWRPQFAPEPARCFPRFHGINKRDHTLMNIIASGAFECPDVKAG